MYWFDVQKHKRPHFHVRHAGREAVYDFSGQALEGDLGSRANRLIKEWCQERESELQNAWSCAVQGKEIPWILPLE